MSRRLEGRGLQLNTNTSMILRLGLLVVLASASLTGAALPTAGSTSSAGDRQSTTGGQQLAGTAGSASSADSTSTTSKRDQQQCNADTVSKTGCPTARCGTYSADCKEVDEYYRTTTGGCCKKVRLGLVASATHTPPAT